MHLQVGLLPYHHTGWTVKSEEKELGRRESLGSIQEITTVGIKGKNKSIQQSKEKEICERKKKIGRMK
jgi:hypothetical protein